MSWIGWEKMLRAKKQGGLGFRNMRLFNMAMLAKQAWRIVTNEESLMTRVLKGKYFPSSTFFEAKNVPNMSFTWRSILSTRGVVEKGAIRTLGGRSSVRIWDDPWVPKLPNFRIITQRREESDGLMFVKDFWENQRWKVSTLMKLFSQSEIDAIGSIPVPMFEEKDSWSWHYSKDGMYSVKSAYNLLIEEKIREKATTSAGNIEFNWKNIWHACIPPKIKLFAWKCVREGLPVMSRLLTRGIHVDKRCPMCGEEEENTAHALLFCSAASSIWRHSVLRLDTSAVDVHGFREWGNKMYEKIKEKKWWDIFWCLAWGIWLKRNAWVFDRATTIHRAICLVGEFEEANAPDDRRLQEQQDMLRWKAPPAGLYKLNFDVAFQGMRMGFGGILRDEEGDAIMALCSTEFGKLDVEVGEAMAMRTSLMTAMEAGYRNFVLETDNISLFYHLKEAYTPPCLLGSLVKNILTLANSCQRCVFSFVRRSGNRVAHSLAKLSFSFDDYRVWLEDYSPEIQGALCNDIKTVVN